MKRFFKTVVIVGLCTVGVVAAAHVVLGKERARDAAATLQRMAQGEVDQLIARHTDLKAELDKLRDDYPRQIAALRSQLRQIEARLEEIEREATQAADIMRLCEEDISYLEDGVQLAADHGSVEHRGSRYSRTDAGRLLARITQTRELYSAKAQAVSDEREQLNAEAARVTADLASIEAEQAEFETQYTGLLREIETLKRNEKALKLAEKRRCKGEGRHQEAMQTLGQVKEALQRARIEQEERIKAHRPAPRELDYEARARELQAGRAASRD